MFGCGPEMDIRPRPRRLSSRTERTQPRRLQTAKYRAGRVFYSLIVARRAERIVSSPASRAAKAAHENVTPCHRHGNGATRVRLRCWIVPPWYLPNGPSAARSEVVQATCTTSENQGSHPDALRCQLARSSTRCGIERQSISGSGSHERPSSIGFAPGYRSHS